MRGRLSIQIQGLLKVITDIIEHKLHVAPTDPYSHYPFFAYVPEFLAFNIRSELAHLDSQPFDSRDPSATFPYMLLVARHKPFLNPISTTVTYPSGPSQYEGDVCIPLHVEVKNRSRHNTPSPCLLRTWLTSGQSDDTLSDQLRNMGIKR
jgi:hypothetical protein